MSVNSIKKKSQVLVMNKMVILQKFNDKFNKILRKERKTYRG